MHVGRRKTAIATMDDAQRRVMLGAQSGHLLIVTKSQVLARNTCVRRGWLLYNAGKWEVTSAGLAALAAT